MQGHLWALFLLRRKRPPNTPHPPPTQPTSRGLRQPRLTCAGCSTEGATRDRESHRSSRAAPGKETGPRRRQSKPRPGPVQPKRTVNPCGAPDGACSAFLHRRGAMMHKEGASCALPAPRTHARPSAHPRARPYGARISSSTIYMRGPVQRARKRKTEGYWIAEGDRDGRGAGKAA